MPENKRGSLPKIGSDLARVDAHVIQPEEYDELPEPTDEELATAKLYIGGRLVSRSDPEWRAAVAAQRTDNVNDRD